MKTDDYYYLKEGDEIKKGDEVYCDGPDWEPAIHSVGKLAPCPHYTSHRKFRRKINMTTDAKIKVINRKASKSHACSKCGCRLGRNANM